METELGFPLHYNDLSRTRRRDAIEAVASLEGWEAHLFESSRPIQASAGAEHHTRAKLLEAAFTYLAAHQGIEHVVLETRSQPSQGFHQLDLKDHRVVQKLLTRHLVPAAFSIRHADKTEPILALADLAAGARTDHLCAADEAIYPLVAHLVQTIHQIG